MTKKKNSIHANKEQTGLVVNCVMLNVRVNPSFDEPITKTLTAGDTIIILEKVDDWYKTPDGYVMSDFIEIKE